LRAVLEKRLSLFGGSGVSRLPSLQCEPSGAEGTLNLVELGKSDTIRYPHALKE
jgi:hypothetical protein